MKKTTLLGGLAVGVTALLVGAASGQHAGIVGFGNHQPAPPSFFHDHSRERVIGASLRRRRQHRADARHQRRCAVAVAAHGGTVENPLSIFEGHDRQDEPAGRMCPPRQSLPSPRAGA